MKKTIPPILFAIYLLISFGIAGAWDHHEEQLINSVSDSMENYQTSYHERLEGFK